MSDLVIFTFSLAGFRRAFQRSFEVVFWNGFDVGWRAGKILGRESIAVELSQRLSICEKPRFHGLNHKKHAMNSHRGEVPVVALAKMSYRVPVDNWGFGVYEKHESFS